MLRTKIVILVLPVTMLGLFGAAILPQATYSQTDYEEYLTETNTEQTLNQQNTGSGSSTNINCGANTVGTNLAQPIMCPSIPGETPTPGTLTPVVTQRAVEVQLALVQINSVISPCNPDEVVTGGGYDVSFVQDDSRILEESAVNNGWQVRIIANNPSPDRMIVFAECLKIVPS